MYQETRYLVTETIGEDINVCTFRRLKPAVDYFNESAYPAVLEKKFTTYSSPHDVVDVFELIDVKN